MTEPTATGVPAEVVQEVHGVEGGVVVGTDVSAGGRAALAFGIDEARRRGCPLHVLRAWTIGNAPRPEGSGFGSVPSMTEFEAAVRDELEAEVDEVFGAMGVPRDAVDARLLVVHGPAANVLVAASRLADLMVIGARGRGGFVGLLLGGISDQVVRFSQCPITIVHGDKSAPPR